MRPASWGMTVTDSNAPLRPISLRYVGTSRDAAREIVTIGAALGGAAAPAFPLLHADVDTNASAASQAKLPRIERRLASGVTSRAQRGKDCGCIGRVCGMPFHREI